MAVSDTKPVAAAPASRKAKPRRLLPSPAGSVPADPLTLARAADAELTPAARQALAALVAEVEQLRRELSEARTRIGYLERLADEDPLMPVAWARTYHTATDKDARVFATTMGASQDLESVGLRRLLVNACYWCLRMENAINPQSSVALVGEDVGLDSGPGERPAPTSHDEERHGEARRDFARARHPAHTYRRRARRNV